MTRQLATNIMVKPPYSILNTLHKKTDQTVTATVHNEFSLTEEAGPISASEAGRHLAILGSIALSLTRDFPHYYLAIDAEITRYDVICIPSKTLHLEASVDSQTERKGHIVGHLYDDEQALIYDIKVTYKILSVPLFSKLFKAYHHPKCISEAQQGYNIRKQISKIALNATTISANYGLISPENCRGHFEAYPALPVAIICGAFTELGLKLFFHNHPNTFQKAIATHAHISATRLVFAGEVLDFKGVVQSITPQTITIYFEGLVAHKKVAAAIFKIQGVSQQ